MNKMPNFITEFLANRPESIINNKGREIGTHVAVEDLGWNDLSVEKNISCEETPTYEEVAGAVINNYIIHEKPHIVEKKIEVVDHHIYRNTIYPIETFSQRETREETVSTQAVIQNGSITDPSCSNNSIITCVCE